MAAWPHSTSTGQPRHHLTARARSAACSAVHSSRVMGLEQRGRLPAAARDSRARLSSLVAVMRSRLCWCGSGSRPSWRRSNALDSSGAGRVYSCCVLFFLVGCCGGPAPDMPAFAACLGCLAALNDDGTASAQLDSTMTGQPRHNLTASARSAWCSLSHSSLVPGSEQWGRRPRAPRATSAAVRRSLAARADTARSRVGLTVPLFGEECRNTAAESAESAPEETAEARVFASAKPVLRALESGNGRGRFKVEELSERLEEDGVTFTPIDLSETLMRLEDCGQIVRVQRQPFSGYPQFLVVKSRLRKCSSLQQSAGARRSGRGWLGRPPC